jgi:hypothetical protein
METTFSPQRKAGDGEQRRKQFMKMVPEGFNACRAALEGGHKLMVDITRSKGV